MGFFKKAWSIVGSDTINAALSQVLLPMDKVLSHK